MYAFRYLPVCSLFTLGACGWNDIRLWKDGKIITQRLPVRSEGSYPDPATENEVFIMPSGDMPHDRYWLRSLDDDNKLVVSTNTLYDQHQRWKIHSKNGQYGYRIENTAGTNFGQHSLVASTDSSDTHVWLSLQSQSDSDYDWYFTQVSDGYYHICSISHPGLLDQQLEADQATNESVKLRAGSSRRRGNMLYAHQGGDVELDDVNAERTRWRIEVAGCPVWDGDSIIGSWEYKTTIPDGMTSKDYTKGYVKATEEQLHLDYRVSVHAKAKMGVKLGGFAGAKVKLRESMSANFVGDYESEFVDWQNDHSSYDIQPEDWGNKFWQFKFESTDICGNHFTTYLDEHAWTGPHDDIIDAPPCCLPGHFDGKVSSRRCTERKYVMPGGEQSCTWKGESGSGAQIQSTLSGRCLDLPGGDTTNGNLLWMWDCYGGEGQQWSFQDDKLVYVANPSKCVDLLSWDTTNGNALGLWDCYDDAPYQQWGFDSVGGTIYLYNSAHDATKCIRIGGENQGESVEIWDCDWNDQMQAFAVGGSKLGDPQPALMV